jgi:hypothetical protein
VGLISKQLRKSGNQRLADAVLMYTPMAPAAAGADVTAACQQLNDNFERWRAGLSKTRQMLTVKGNELNAGQFKYHPELDADAGRGRIGFAKTPAEIDRLPLSRRSYFDDWWLAAFTCTAATDGGTTIELSLLRRVVDSNGKINNRDRYEHLRDELLRRYG